MMDGNEWMNGRARIMDGNEWMGKDGWIMMDKRMDVHEWMGND